MFLQGATIFKRNFNWHQLVPIGSAVRTVDTGTNSVTTAWSRVAADVLNSQVDESDMDFFSPWKVTVMSAILRKQTTDLSPIFLQNIILPLVLLH
jgi:hypothetical protein